MKINGKKLLIDSNILIYSADSLSPKYDVSVIFMKSAVDGLFFPVISHQNILETTRVLTHKRYDNPFTANEISILTENLEKFCDIIFPNRETWEIMKALLGKYKVISNRIFDCYLVATMLSNDIKIIATDNVKDLAVFEEIKVYNPYNLSS